MGMSGVDELAVQALTNPSFIGGRTEARDKLDTPVAACPVSPSGFSSLKLEAARFPRGLFSLLGLPALPLLAASHQT